ncbi:MAG TPA: hypothetical protein VJ599_04335 [Nitrososphaeraceae archaeon]|nr:hypothetical protein [Nitrososphaeraceae archaeon]
MQNSIFVIFLIGVIVATMIASATIANPYVMATHKSDHSDNPSCDHAKKDKHCPPPPPPPCDEGGCQF